MKNSKILKEIHHESESINRNIMQLSNIGLMGLLAWLAKEAKASDNRQVKSLIRIGLFLTMIFEMVLMIGNIRNYRENKDDNCIID